MVHLNRIFQPMLHSGHWKRFLVNYKPFAFTLPFLIVEDGVGGGGGRGRRSNKGGGVDTLFQIRGLGVRNSLGGQRHLKFGID